MMWKHELRHDGVIFPPAYKEKGLLLYPKKAAAKKVSALILPAEAEEIGIMFARISAGKDLDHMLKSNFWKDWTSMLNPKDQRLSHHSSVDEWDFDRLLGDSKKPSQESTTQKNVAAPPIVIADGIEQKVGRGFRVDGPGIFMSHDIESEFRGRIRRRLAPADIILNRTAALNRSRDEGWGKVISDNTAAWVASWKDPVTGKQRYIYLDAISPQKQKRESKKFEFARRYGQHRTMMMQAVTKDLLHDVLAVDSAGKRAQCATCFFLLDAFFVRPGHDKDGSTRGLVSLRVENVLIMKQARSYSVKLDFIGKDSLHFVGTARVQMQVAVNLVRLVEGKNQDDLLFHTIHADHFNQYLDELMPGLTAKVIRTHKVSLAFEKSLHLAEKKMKLFIRKPQLKSAAKTVFKIASVRAAALCNHQKTTQSCDPSLDPESVFANKQGVDVIAKRISEKLPHVASENGRRLSMRDFQCWAPSTTLANYIDPRIVVAFCKRNGLKLQDVVSAALVSKMKWAQDTPGTFTLLN